MLGKEPYKSDFSAILQLVEIMLVIPVTSAECEKSHQNRIKSVTHRSMSSTTLDQLVRITKVGPPVELYDPQIAINKLLSSGQRPGRTVI
jgi:hypothetical protein